MLVKTIQTCYSCKHYLWCSTNMKQTDLQDLCLSSILSFTGCISGCYPNLKIKTSLKDFFVLGNKEEECVTSCGM